MLGQLRSLTIPPSNGHEPDLTISFVDDPPYYVAYVENTAIADMIHSWEMLRWIERIIDQLILKHVRGYALFHAAALVIDGGAILLPGTSGSGKSTLALGLVERGYDYLSDEVGAIDLAGTFVHPFAKPITLKSKSVFPQFADRLFGAADGERFQQLAPVWYLHPDDVRPHAVATSTPLHLIALPIYAPDAASRLERVAPADIVPHLVRHAVNWSGAYFPVVMKLAREIPCFTLISDTLKDAITLFEEAISAPLG